MCEQLLPSMITSTHRLNNVRKALQPYNLHYMRKPFILILLLDRENNLSINPQQPPNHQHFIHKESLNYS